MGQLWQIVNLDKRQTLKCEFWEQFFYPNGLATLLRVDFNNDAPSEHGSASWVGDRIVCVGDYTDEMPAGLLTEKEMRQAERYEMLWEFFSNFDDITRWFYSSVDLKPKVGVTYALRNLSKHEFVLNNFLFKSGRLQCGFGGFLASRICWSADTGISMAYEPRWPGDPCLTQGRWAGDRFDVVKSDFKRNGETWKDVTEDAINELRQIWISDLESDEDHFELVRYNGSFDKPFSVPVEIIRLICELAADDMATATALRLVSKTVSSWITPILYRKPIISSQLASTAFKDSIKAHSKLGQFVRRLYHSPTSAPLEKLPNLQVLFTSKLPNNVQGQWPHLWFIMCAPNLKNVLPKRPASSLFKNVTHLCINSADLKILSKCGPKKFPRLTHLIINVLSVLEDVARILDLFSGLEMVLLVAETYYPDLGCYPRPFTGDV
ncbi:hypothetical protein VKT23_018961 [Stygiomarasmius scandens]|uniref:F-box domain-containing protein n=1 Tax=Marasmiellus scandens TaxID=2682957 RepID=A0ABR1IRN5_9AGAR